MLHSFNSRVEVNMIWNAAYSRFKPISPIDVIINERTSRCRHMVNILNLSEDISSLNLSQQLIHFENMSFAEQGTSKQSTRVLISIHGAGLSNIIFLQPGSTVIELMHPLLRALFDSFLFIPLSTTSSSEMWSLWMIHVLVKGVEVHISNQISLWIWQQY